MNSPRTLLAAASAALIPRPAWSWAQTATEPNKYEWDHMSHMMWGGGWLGMIFGLLFMILALAAAVAVVFLVIRWLGGPGYGAQPPYHPPPSSTPLDILKDRFARGEISKEEYEERRRVLEQ